MVLSRLDKKCSRAELVAFLSDVNENGGTKAAIMPDGKKAIVVADQMLAKQVFTSPNFTVSQAARLPVKIKLAIPFFKNTFDNVFNIDAPRHSEL